MVSVELIRWTQQIDWDGLWWLLQGETGTVYLREWRRTRRVARRRE